MWYLGLLALTLLVSYALITARRARAAKRYTLVEVERTKR